MIFMGILWCKDSCVCFICINTSSEDFMTFTISSQYYQVVKTENNGTSIVKIAP